MRKINKWGKNCFNNVTKCPICNSKKIKKIYNIQSKIFTNITYKHTYTIGIPNNNYKILSNT